MPTTYDKRDFSGIWYGRNNLLMGNKVPPMTPAGKAVFDTYRPSDIQSPSKLFQAFEWTHNYREIWTNNITVPEDPDPRWYGWAVGKWEGDTLVINSKGFNPKNWLNDEGYPQSEKSTVQERWTRTAYDTLELMITVTDPEYYTAPWVSAKPQIFKLQLPKDRTILEEAFCVPSEEQSFNENVRDPAGTGQTKK
jgi:hypothetical protein